MQTDKLASDIEFAGFLALLKRHGLEAHTKIKGGSLILVKRRPKRNRKGEWK